MNLSFTHKFGLGPTETIWNHGVTPSRNFAMVNSLRLAAPTPIAERSEPLSTLALDVPQHR